MRNQATPKLEYRNGRPSVLRKATVWRELNFYKRSEILYQLTVAFCRRFLPKYGDRTVDQMIQAARSTKQNIIEGYSDGQTSFETEIKLLGVARGSNQELLADYGDYLESNGLVEWKGGRYEVRAVRPSLNVLAVALRKLTANHAERDDS